MVVETSSLESEDVQLKGEDRGFNASLKHLEQLCLLIDDIIKFDVNANLLGYRNNLKHFWILACWHLDRVERKKGDTDWKEVAGMKLTVDFDEGRTICDPGLPAALDNFFSWVVGRLMQHEVLYSKKSLKELGLDKQRMKYGL